MEESTSIYWANGQMLELRQKHKAFNGDTIILRRIVFCDLIFAFLEKLFLSKKDQPFRTLFASREVQDFNHFDQAPTL